MLRQLLLDMSHQRQRCVHLCSARGQLRRASARCVRRSSSCGVQRMRWATPHQHLSWSTFLRPWSTCRTSSCGEVHRSCANNELSRVSAYIICRTSSSGNISPAPAVGYVAPVPSVEYISPAPPGYAASALVPAFSSPAPPGYADSALVTAFSSPAAAVYPASAPVVQRITPVRWESSSPAQYAGPAHHEAATMTVTCIDLNRNDTPDVLQQSQNSYAAPMEYGRAMSYAPALQNALTVTENMHRHDVPAVSQHPLSTTWFLCRAVIPSSRESQYITRQRHQSWSGLKKIWMKTTFQMSCNGPSWLRRSCAALLCSAEDRHSRPRWLWQTINMNRDDTSADWQQPRLFFCISVKLSLCSVEDDQNHGRNWTC